VVKPKKPLNDAGVSPMAFLCLWVSGLRFASNAFGSGQLRTNRKTVELVVAEARAGRKDDNHLKHQRHYPVQPYKESWPNWGRPLLVRQRRSLLRSLLFRTEVHWIADADIVETGENYAYYEIHFERNPRQAT
jgi:hypothetical protein